MSEAIDRILEKNEYVHHINENHSDNRLDNLFLCSPKEHVRIHRLMKKGKSRSETLQIILNTRQAALAHRKKPGGLRSRPIRNASEGDYS